MKRLKLKIILAILLYTLVVLGTFTDIANPIPTIVMYIFVFVFGTVVVLRESNRIYKYSLYPALTYAITQVLLILYEPQQMSMVFDNLYFLLLMFLYSLFLGFHKRK